MLNGNVLSEKEEEEDKREKKMSLASTRIISTSINQVDSPFSLSFYGSILSIFLNMQAQEVTSSQKSLTRYRHMLTYS
jgi:glycine betaine/choline ABC-type transport system substrate-binding protein